MGDVASTNASLQQLLDVAELKYDQATDAAGRSCAVFRHDVAGHGMADVTARLTGQQLRFVVDRVMRWDGSQEHLEWCSFVNMEWAFGNLFLDASGTWLNASVSMYVGSGLPGRNQVRYVVTHLMECVRKLREGELPYYEAQQGQQGQQGQHVTLGEVKEALVRCQLAPSTSPDGKTLGQKLIRRDVEVTAAFYLFDEGALLNLLFQFAQSWRVADRAEAVRQLQSINQDLDYGTVNLNTDTGMIQCHLGIPMAWSVLDESLMKWAISNGLAIMVDRVLPTVRLLRH